MWNSIRHLDRLLRGQSTSLEQFQADRFDLPVVGLTAIIVLLGMMYGICMGLFAITGSGNGAWMQIPATMVKVPALFLLTLLVTFPSLYVFNALVGSRLTFAAVLQLLIASLAVILAVLSSLGPIVAFFSVSTTSYHFILLLNVCVYAISGALGLTFLLQTLHRMSISQSVAPPPIEPASAQTPKEIGALDQIHGHVLGPHVRLIFRIWIVVFGLVGAQMAWVLRPFIGRPDVPFTWLRAREANFFQALWDLLIAGWGSR